MTNCYQLDAEKDTNGHQAKAAAWAGTPSLQGRSVSLSVSAAAAGQGRRSLASCHVGATPTLGPPPSICTAHNSGWVQSSHTRNPFSFLSWTQSGVGLPRRGHVVASAQCPGSSGVWFETQALGPPRLRLQPPRGTASLGKDPRPGDRKLRLAEPLAAGETRHCCSRLPKMLAFCLSWIFRTNSYFLKYV